MKEFMHTRLDNKSFTDEEIKSLIKEYNIKFIKLQFVDINGQVKNMTIPSQHIEKALNNEIMLDGSSIKGFRSIETSDMFFHPDKNTFQILPWREKDGINSARLICDIYNADGTPFEGCPRCNLKRVMKEAEKMGFSMNVGPEAEFFLFAKDEEGNVTTTTQDSAGYYDVGPEDLGEDVRSDIVLTLQEMGFDIEASHHEVADGQHEVDFRYADVLTAADNVATFKIAVKAIAAKHNLHATFMPKPIYGINGSGMHCNVSLFKDGKNAFYDEDAEFQLSDIAKYAIGGMLKHVKSITAILNPTVNSYKRLVPGYEAPTYIVWSASNRSCLVRIPAARGMGTRVELRSPDPACNPYLEMALCLAAGLDGIKKGMEPAPAVDYNVFELTDEEMAANGIDCLPGSLEEAVKASEADPFIREIVGDHVFNAYTEGKKNEWDSYRTKVSQWEIDEYIVRY